jgi:hypothetical protein
MYLLAPESTTVLYSYAGEWSVECCYRAWRSCSRVVGRFDRHTVTVSFVDHPFRMRSSNG